MQRLARLCWAWLPVLAWMALILWMSGRSDLPVRTNPQTGETIKTTFTLAKIAHVVEYGVLALLLLRATTGQHGGLRLAFRTAAIGTVLICGLFGGLDEFQQSLVPNREPRLLDIAIDTLSALAVCLVIGGWLRFKQPSAAGVSGSGVRAGPDAAERPAPQRQDRR